MQNSSAPTSVANAEIFIEGATSDNPFIAYFATRALGGSLQEAMHAAGATGQLASHDEPPAADDFSDAEECEPGPSLWTPNTVNTILEIATKQAAQVARLEASVNSLLERERQAREAADDYIGMLLACPDFYAEERVKALA